MRLTVLGATGSIGTQTLDIVCRHRSLFSVYALSARSNWRALLGQCLSVRPRFVVLDDEDSASAMREQLHSSGLPRIEVLVGRDGLERVVSDPEVEVVMAAITGFSGAEPVLLAARAGKTILLANKESVVTTGHLLRGLLRDGSANILPVDSEHNAIYQCLANPGWRVGMPLPADVERLILTASGGPFLGRDAAELSAVTPEQACAHPNWEMGRKISVDSATMANKALELIECSYLFDSPHRSIDILVHPQSIVHAMVVYRDGSFMTQLSDSDMRVAISYTLARALGLHRDGSGSARLDSGARALDWAQTPQLNFQPLDDARYPIVSVARSALDEGPAALISFNAINEELVRLFLARRISFTRIASALAECLAGCRRLVVDSWEQVCAQDRLARVHCRQIIDAEVRSL